MVRPILPTYSLKFLFMLGDMDFADNIALLETTQYGTQQLTTASGSKQGWSINKCWQMQYYGH